jgi:uncharacterized protein
MVDDAVNPLTEFAASLEAMRNIGLTLTAQGKFIHQGQLVTHARLHLALLGWLDVTPDGRDIVRLEGERFAYVTVEDTHLRATSARWADDRCFVHWDDGSEEELAYATLKLRSDNSIECAVHGKLRGALRGQAHYAIGERLVEADGWYQLAAAGTRWDIGEH